MPDRLRECALSHAVDEAVAGRSAVLSAGPGELAAHVLDGMSGYLAGEIRCGDEELEFLARPYRWARLADQLGAAHRADPAAGRHRSSADWEQAYGRAVPGADLRAQLEAVRGWLRADTADASVRRLVAFGAGVLERAVGSSFGASNWPERLRSSVDESFAECRWPERFLIPQTVVHRADYDDRTFVR
jgi:hypothetical protein